MHNGQGAYKKHNKKEPAKKQYLSESKIILISPNTWQQWLWNITLHQNPSNRWPINGGYNMIYTQEFANTIGNKEKSLSTVNKMDM